MSFPGDSDSKEPACRFLDLGSKMLGSRRCPGNGNDNALQYSCLENSMDRGAWKSEFPGGSDGKESACNVGDLGLIFGLGRSPGGGYGNPLQYSCLENPHGQRSLVGYRSWGPKESDMAEQLSTAYNLL